MRVKGEGKWGSHTAHVKARESRASHVMARYIYIHFSFFSIGLKGNGPRELGQL